MSNFLDQTGLTKALKGIKSWCENTFSKTSHTHSNYLTSHQTLYDNNIRWGGSVLNDVSPVDAGCTDEFGHNKLAFLPASCIAVEYSTDGGTTWLDYGLTDSQKVAMVSTYGSGMYLGKASNLSYKDGTLNASNYKNYKLRITLCTAAMSSEGTTNYGTYLYTAAKKLLINVSTNGASGIGLTIQRRTVGDFNNGTDTWIAVNSNPYVLYGWSGWNSIPFAIAFGGTWSQTSNVCRDVRLIFEINALGNVNYANVPTIYDIRMIGTTNWATSNEMARAGRLYTIDTYQSAAFPNHINPSINNSQNLGQSSMKWANVYATNFDGKINNHIVNADVPSTAKFTDTVLTESDVSGWGFTKNTGTYSKPSDGIPKTDLASAVQTSLGKADSAIQDISGKQDKITSSNKLDYSLLSNTPTIPSAVTETTVSGWGFTKNTGTYSKPSGGIPKTDLASAVQTSLGKADSAIQSSDLSWTSIAPSDFFTLGTGVTFASSAGRVYINESLRLVRFIVNVTITPASQLAVRNEGTIFSAVKSTYADYKPAWFVPCTAFRDGTGSTYPIAAQMGTTGSVGVRFNAAISAGTGIAIKIGGFYNY